MLEPSSTGKSVQKSMKRRRGVPRLPTLSANERISAHGRKIMSFATLAPG
jgi:hypothetical protein